MANIVKDKPRTTYFNVKYKVCGGANKDAWWCRIYTHPWQSAFDLYIWIPKSLCKVDSSVDLPYGRPKTEGSFVVSVANWFYLKQILPALNSHKARYAI